MHPMQQALRLATSVLGNVSPNPAVGAVVVADGRVVGMGATLPPPGRHAELVALAEAGESARGATMYVTLEPHAHRGRTPPCTDAIVGAGVRQVCIALVDPNPMVNGRGIEALRSAGIGVVLADRDSPEARASAQITQAFAKHVTTGLPLVVAKFAASLDGKLATSSGESRWISGLEARRHAHWLRAKSDAVMVGSRTVAIDDPQLTARYLEQPSSRQPLRVVVEGQTRLPNDAALLGEPGETVVVTAAAGRRVPGAEVISLPGIDGRVDLPALLRHLGARGVTSVLVEGGSVLLGSLFDQRLVDKVVVFIAPVIVGGAGAPSPVRGTGAVRLADALRLRHVTYRQIGEDVVVTGYPTGSHVS